MSNVILTQFIVDFIFSSQNYESFKKSERVTMISIKKNGRHKKETNLERSVSFFNLYYSASGLALITSGSATTASGSTSGIA